MVFNFELEEENIMDNCDNCQFGLLKHYNTMVQNSLVVVVGVCDTCGAVYRSSEKLYSLGSIAYIGA